MGNEARRILLGRQETNHFESYPGGSLQFVLDMSFSTPFSRLVEGGPEADAVPADKKVKRKSKKRARRTHTGR